MHSLTAAIAFSVLTSSLPASAAPNEHALSTARFAVDMRELVPRFEADRGAVGRIWRVEGSVARRERMRACMREWLAELAQVDFDALDQGGKVDWILLKREAEHQLAELDLDEERWKEMAELVPFVERIAALGEARRRLEDVDAKAAASELDRLAKDVEALRKSVDEKPRVVVDPSQGGLLSPRARRRPFHADPRCAGTGATARRRSLSSRSTSFRASRRDPHRDDPQDRLDALRAPGLTCRGLARTS